MMARGITSNFAKSTLSGKYMRLLVVLLTPPTALCLSGVFSSGGDKIAVQPVKLLRLLNSVYASDNLLLFGRVEE